MKLSTIGIVCFALISAASAQYAYSPALIQARGEFVKQHVAALVDLDKSYFRFYEHVRQTVEGLVVPFREAHDAYIAALETVTPASETNGPFSSFNSSLEMTFASIFGNGDNPIDPVQTIMQSVQGTGPDWAAPAYNQNMRFSQTLSTLMNALSMNPYTSQPKPDACVTKVFGRAQAVYAANVDKVLTDADEAINTVDEANAIATIYIEAVKEELDEMIGDLVACAGDVACLDGLQTKYAYFSPSSANGLQYFSMSISTISQQYPGYSSDNSYWLYNVAQMC